MFDPQHKNDFAAVYDLRDPRPYYRALEPTGYRMPQVVADFVKLHRPFLEQVLGERPLTVVDFACGFGANGALLRHRLDLAGLYGHYATPAADAPATGVPPGEELEADRRFFARRRRTGPPRVVGIDVAPNALAYAAANGLVDATFCEDLTTAEASEGLRHVLSGGALVVEAGGIGGLLPVVFRRLIDASRPGPRPWFFLGLRPDVDPGPLRALWREAEYRVETGAGGRVPYRRPLGAPEHEEVLALAARHGIPAEEAVSDGYIAVETMAASPREHPPLPVRGH